MKTFALVNPLLRNREETVSKVLNNACTGRETAAMLLLSVLLFSVFGLIIGASHSLPQAMASAIKLPLLFYLTAGICFPTLFFFLSFLGARQQFGQLLSFIVLCNTYMALVLAAFAPVSFFFLITGYGYALFKFINVLIFAVAGSTGIYLFYGEMRKIMLGIDPEKADDKMRKGLLFLRGWALLFAFIGMQLSFTLSPFFGLPGNDFIWFTPEKANFFSNLLQTIAQLFIGS